MRRILPPAEASVGGAARWVLGCAIALALACGADEATVASGADAPSPPVQMAIESAVEELGTPVPPPPMGSAPKAAAPDAPAPPVAARSDEPALEAGEAAPSADVKPLTDLLRLPAVEPVDRATERAADRLKLEPPAATGETAATDAPESRLKVEYESRTDEAELMNRARKRTDAGVSVQTGEGTRLKTGVRVEQEEGLERESPVPTVGIEKRF